MEAQNGGCVLQVDERIRERVSWVGVDAPCEVGADQALDVQFLGDLQVGSYVLSLY